MKSFTFRILSFSLILVTLLASRAQAQIDPNIQQGLQLFSSYHGGNLDSINLQNGHLSFHAPFYSLPQRGGKLNLSFSIRYDNTTGTVLHQNCLPPPSHMCTYFVAYGGTSVGIFNDQGIIVVGQSVATSQFDCCGHPVKIPCSPYF